MRRLLSLLAGVLVLAGACGGAPAADGPEQGDGAAAAPAASSPSGPARGAPGPASAESAATLLDFTAPLVGGGTFDGRATAGADLAVWFWSPW